jgi:predicted membrane-bound mannosyltransferase
MKEEQQPERKQLDIWWLASAAAVTVIAVFLRFYWLTLKPLHHDEGVNGFFLTNLFRDGVYRYDPENYHGPTLYYISLAFTTLFGGLETFPIRASVAVFGVLIVVLALFLRRYLGNIGALAAATFLAVSPGMVYISRYFIHEIFFIFLAIAIAVSVVFFIERRRAGPVSIIWMVILLLVCFLPSALSLASALLNALGSTSDVALWSFRAAFIIVELVLIYFVIKMLREWNNGRPVYLLLCSASVALMFATKETAFITLGTMSIACLCVWLWRPISSSGAFERNRTTILAGATILALIGAGIYAKPAFGWLYENFLGEGKVHEPFVFYSILLLLGLALAAWALFLKYYRGEEQSQTFAEPAQLSWQNFHRGVGTGADRWLAIAAISAVFIYIIVLFFSSFFTYSEGVAKAFEAYSFWTKTGNRDHTQNGLLGYVKWGFKVEAPLLIIGAVGAAIAIVKGRHRFAMFAALWAWGLFLGYSIIPYKTPWLAISFYLPMCLVAGYAINELIRAKAQALKITGAALAILGTAVLTYQTYQLNFVRYDDEEMAYVYAHTKREMLNLVERIEYYAAKSGEYEGASVEIVSPEYWPLTWYLLDYKQAIFHGQFTDANAAEMIVMKKGDQDSEAIRRYAAHYKFDGVYPLRPGVDLVLLVNKSLADPQAQDLYKVLEYEKLK